MASQSPRRRRHTPPVAYYQPDELLINFHDVCVYGRDLALLESPRAWLNDVCIHFAMTDLQVTHDADEAKKRSINSNNKSPTTTLFLDPTVVSFLMHQCDDSDDLDDFCRGCRNFDNITRLVVPINDTLTCDNWAVPRAGSHWSLLVLDRRHNCGRDDGRQANGDDVVVGHHLDSVLASRNAEVAQAVADKIVMASNGAFASSSTSSSSSSSSSAMIAVQQCPGVPQQRNGYDCGVHVIGAAQAIASVSNSQQQQQPKSPTTASSLQDFYEKAVQEKIGQSTSFCTKLRQELGQRIRQLAADL